MFLKKQFRNTVYIQYSKSCRNKSKVNLAIRSQVFFFNLMLNMKMIVKVVFFYWNIRGVLCPKENKKCEV